MALHSQTDILNALNYDFSFTTEYDTNQTNLSILTPTTGKSLQIKGIYINTEASSGEIRLFFTGNTVMKTFAANGPVTGYVPLGIDGTQNEALKMTSNLGADQNFFILVNYSEK